MNKNFALYCMALVTTGTIIAINGQQTCPVNNLTLENIEALAFMEGPEHDVTIPCKEQKQEICVERFYDANGNFVGTQTFKKRVRTSN